MNFANEVEFFIFNPDLNTLTKYKFICLKKFHSARKLSSQSSRFFVSNCRTLWPEVAADAEVASEEPEIDKSDSFHTFKAFLRATLVPGKPNRIEMITWKWVSAISSRSDMK